MELSLCLILFLSHWIGDFVIQSQWIRGHRFPSNDSHIKKDAGKMMLKGNLVHVICHLAVILPLIWINHVTGVRVLVSIGIYVISHFIIDFSKSLFSYRKKGLDFNLYLFLLDQGLHLIILAVMFCDKIPNWFLGCIADWSWENRVLLGCSAIVMATFFVGTFIKIYMNYLDLRNPSTPEIKEPEVDGEIRRGGYLIGILERSFIISAMMMDLPQLIGFMLGVKTIVRLKKMSKDKFAEYFLIGNLLSFLCAILGGIALKFIWG